MAAKKKFKKQDIVLHHADSKTWEWRMVVIGYTRDGLVKTQYVELDKPREVYHNDEKNLKPISEYGFDENEIIQSLQVCKNWNEKHPIGTVVEYNGLYGGIETAKTRSGAYIGRITNRPIILLEDHIEYFYLDKVWITKDA